MIFVGIFIPIPIPCSRPDRLAVALRGYPAERERLQERPLDSGGGWKSLRAAIASARDLGGRAAALSARTASDGSGFSPAPRVEGGGTRDELRSHRTYRAHRP